MQLLKRRVNSTRRRVSTTDDKGHDALETTRAFVSSLDLSRCLKYWGKIYRTRGWASLVVFERSELLPCCPLRCLTM